ncbi:tRNA (adenosine(37)-N6)-threonylcarbamoyltransferase complex dimerization subunit type 1 TsaB [Thalassobacillus devorans]|uniref:tRNA (Adenosine(37)-N6)-threonylcarbamoyltransferase complex dimerization subunit type 1 TsaB n=1 Tax=Thalassobacillus devorans TaxID=279813 RepID=A0ABQ1PHF5_9BACI|nr:tRNA (adenosine(37)-N6)-threonylcarbamoyltransferase complex dimerization subunit type 1 TsaB [Thalassobacillus devorans]NIK29968.1 tRNA threonylcarbamoyladenosine biosynthesis protein TsaB [Thalassobacillus devorans]GGC97263.1 tRNA (adenosine(37)-N6)-threonylcarbamoyltransferase complex dimerization subunit type 1 TsaB [Thalassobacillus devorans]
MNVLAIDTSNQILGVAVVKNGETAGELITNIKKNHSVRLMPAIAQLMKETGVTPSDLDRIVVAKGPGSYTGVRIGLTTAKSMGWALNIPVIGVSSLEVLAYQGMYFNGSICPFFDARRGLVYTGLYDQDMKLLKDETNMLMAEWLEELKEREEPILFLSQDVELHREAIEEILGDQAIIPPQACHAPRPSALALAGENKEAESLHGLVPNYLRLVEAEAKWLEQQEKK